MSLISYPSRDNREIVLRHQDAIVLRDPQTQQLILRGASTNPALPECPTCHRPFRSSSREGRQVSAHPSSQSAPFISPEYFRMLQQAYAPPDEPSPPSSPIRRLVEPAFSSPASNTSVADAEFVTSTPAPSEGHSIKKEAFSPNYFKSFFVEEKELGRGGKGVVLLVRHELDRVSLGQFACKRVPVGDDHAWLEKVLIEVQLLQGLSHPNLVSYRHVWLEDVKLHRFGPSVPCAFILQQYCNAGDLLHYVVGAIPDSVKSNEELKDRVRRRSRGQADRPDDTHPLHRKLTFEEIYSFFKDITSGLAHLHASNYIHRDLKPSNCLLHRDGNDVRCLISDFGEVQPENAVRKSSGSTGTISYCAPEVLKQDRYGKYGNFTTKSDIFSLGMILYFMCFGRLPYKSADVVQEEFEDADLLRAEISGWSGFRDERLERPELPNQLYGFLTRLLSIDPADRPNASDILHAIRTEKNLEHPSRSRPGSSSGITDGGRIRDIESSQPLADSRRIRPFPQLQDASSSSESIPTHSRSSSPLLQRSHDHKVDLATPLLMPPPGTPFLSIQSRLSFYSHYLLIWAQHNRQTLTLLLRLVIFLSKLSSIMKACTPAAAREVVWYPLMGVAALELGLGSRVTLGWVAMLLLLHVNVLGSVARWGGGLCEWSEPRWSA